MKSTSDLQCPILSAPSGMFPLTLNSEVKVKKTDIEQNNGKISQKLVFLLFYARYRAHEDDNTPIH